jgi:ribonuclease P protein component
MLKRLYRLPAQQTLISPVTIHTDSLVMKIAPNELPYSRFGFVVSRKVAKQATVRNRSKRQIRSCIENMFLQIVPGYDMLLVLKKRVVSEKLSLCQSLAESLRRKGYLR